MFVSLSTQGEFKVSERTITMPDLIKGLEEKRVKEIFGSGTACVVCPVDRILYQGKVRIMGHSQLSGFPTSILFLSIQTGFLSLLAQNYHIPTMENGPEIAKRFLKELTDIQVKFSAGDRKQI